MRVVSERRIWRDEVYLEVYPDHLAPVHQLERTRIADFCPRNPQSGFATYCRTVNTPHRSAKISPFYESIEVQAALRPRLDIELEEGEKKFKQEDCKTFFDF